MRPSSLQLQLRVAGQRDSGSKMEGVGGGGSGGKLAFHQVALAKRDSGEQSVDESDSSQLHVGNFTLFTLQKTGFGSSVLGFWPRACGDRGGVC